MYLTAQDPGAPGSCGLWGGLSISRGEGGRIGNNYISPWGKSLLD